MSSIVFVIALTACSPGVPSESDARSYFENHCVKKELAAGIIKMDSFTKTNGFKNENSENGYIVEFETTISYLQEANLSHMFPGPNHPVGDKQTVKGSFFFRMTEKGWEPIGGCPNLG